jgi:hypothetical protein
MNVYHHQVDLEMRHLRLVIAVAQTGSVTRAGEQLYLTSVNSSNGGGKRWVTRIAATPACRSLNHDVPSPPSQP